jgi:hypothetical protein
VFQGSNNKKEKKKNNSGEDDLTYGPRDNVIGKSSSIKLYLIFLRENSTNSCGGQDQGRNFGHGLLLSKGSATQIYFLFFLLFPCFIFPFLLVR